MRRPPPRLPGGAQILELRLDALDVEPDGRSVTVRGEGEALIVWNFSPGKATAAELAGTWARLAARHDPGHTPPDVSKVWHGVLEAHLKSAENSP